MGLEDIKYLVVDGPIGVGKSSLATLLAREFTYETLLEAAAQNPFLADFYKDPERFSLQTQLHFLLARSRQQQELCQLNQTRQRVVSDYVFAKDLMFAELNLSDEEFKLYCQIYSLLNQKLPQPDLVIFLQASPEVLLKRIKKRAHDYEQNIQAEYMLKVSQAYSQFFFSYSTCPVLVVNTSGLDFVTHAEDYELLKKELWYLLESGLEKHYVTIAPR